MVNQLRGIRLPNWSRWIFDLTNAIHDWDMRTRSKGLGDPRNRLKTWFRQEACIISTASPSSKKGRWTKCSFGRQRRPSKNAIIHPRLFRKGNQADTISTVGKKDGRKVEFQYKSKGRYDRCRTSHGRKGAKCCMAFDSWNVSVSFRQLGRQPVRSQWFKDSIW